MSSEKLNLAKEFEKIYIDPIKKQKIGDNNAPLCEKQTTTTTVPSDSIAIHSSHQSLKVSRKKNYIKPSRLKFIYKTQTKAFKEFSTSHERKTEDAEDFSGESFLLLRNLRISSSSEMIESSLSNPTNDEKEDKVLSTSCSVQYNLQQQLSSSSEFDSTIDAMSDYFSYHLNLYKDKNYLVDSMYT